MSWLTGEWSGVHRVMDRNRDPWFGACENRPGLYRLVALSDAVVPSPATLQRVCAPDTSGTIYIGSAGSLTGRLSDLVKRHHPEFKTANHKPLPPRLAADFQPNNLAICWTYLPKEADRYAEERKLITAYTGEFREPPPLNVMP